MSESTTVSALEIPRIGHAEAMRITATENGRLLDQVRALGQEDWQAATDCPRWTVRDMVVHLIASAQAQANPAEFARQVWRGRPPPAEIGGPPRGGGGHEGRVRGRPPRDAEPAGGRGQKGPTAAPA